MKRGYRGNALVWFSVGLGAGALIATLNGRYLTKTARRVRYYVCRGLDSAAGALTQLKGKIRTSDGEANNDVAATFI